MQFALCVALALLGATSAHPAYLDCGGLSFAIKNGSNIMTGPPQKVAMADATFQLQKSSGSLSSTRWTNYSIRLTKSDAQMVVQVASNLTAITCFGHGICGSDPRRVGHGLCQKCDTQLYAADFDCTDNGCIFGLAGDGKSKVTVLVGTSSGGLVFYTPVVLDAWRGDGRWGLNASRRLPTFWYVLLGLLEGTTSKGRPRRTTSRGRPRRDDLEGKTSKETRDEHVLRVRRANELGRHAGGAGAGGWAQDRGPPIRDTIGCDEAPTRGFVLGRERSRGLGVFLTMSARRT